MMEKNMMLFTSTSPMYPITAHRLALLIGEGIQPSISLEVVTILLHGLLPHSENGVNTNMNLMLNFRVCNNEYKFIRLI
jgi:hypothetical protein